MKKGMFLLFALFFCLSAQTKMAENYTTDNIKNIQVDSDKKIITIFIQDGSYLTSYYINYSTDETKGKLLYSLFIEAREVATSLDIYFTPDTGTGERMVTAVKLNYQ